LLSGKTVQTLKQVLNRYLYKTGLAKGIAQNSAITLWPEIVGKMVAKNATADEVEHGVLMVKTSTPAWRQELQFQKQDILKRINKQIGKNAIKDIRFL